MFPLKLDRLPDGPLRRILVLRTAPLAQVEWAIERLRAAYPEARMAVLGRALAATPLFDGMDHFELEAPWLAPKTYRPFRRSIERAGFDMVVMCLNSDCGAGYGRVSRVVRSVPARYKLVAAYERQWHSWDHCNFEEGHTLVRWAVNALGLLIYPAVALYLLLMPAGPEYMPAGQGRPAPEYDR